MVQRQERITLIFVQKVMLYLLEDPTRTGELEGFVNRFGACIESPWMWDELNLLMKWAERKWPVRSESVKIT